MLDCAEFLEKLDDYINGELSTDENSLMEHHAKNCEACNNELLFTKNLILTLNTLPKLSVDESFADKLNERLDKELAAQKTETKIINIRFINRFSKNIKKYSALAACLILAVVIKAGLWDVVDNTSVDFEPFEPFENNILSNVLIPNETQAPDIQSNNSDVTNDNNAVNINPADSSSKKDESTTTNSQTNNTQKQTTQKNTSSKETQNSAPASKPKSNISNNTQSDVASENETVSDKKELPASTETPQKADNLDYMDNPENVIMSNRDNSQSADEQLSEKSVADKQAKQFSVAPQNSDISTASITEENTDDLSNTFVFVSTKDEETVKEIVSKYFKKSVAGDYYLTPDNYELFIKELKESGIDYKNTFVFVNNSDVLVKIITT